MTPHRILHILGTAQPAGSAIFQIVQNLAAAADPSRYRFEASFLRPGELLHRLAAAGVPSSCVDWSCVDWSGALTDPAGAARYAALLRSSRPHIIHQHTGGRLLTGMGRRLTQARIVRSLHGLASEETGALPDAVRLPPSDVTIANSHAVAALSADPRAVVIYPGIDAHAFSGERTAHQGIVIGTASRLEPIKGVSDLIGAFAALVPEFHHLRLEIAGDGSLRSALVDEAARLGVSGRVSFLGWRDDLPVLMESWDIFVQPSLDEGFGFAVLEAMASALPVVASAVGGLRELVLDGETGWLVPPSSPAELAARLRELIPNEKMRQAMGAAARRRAIQSFSISRMVEQTIAIYDSLLT